MKTSTMFVLLTLGAASLNGAVILPASADDDTPSTNGTGNCSTLGIRRPISAVSPRHQMASRTSMRKSEQRAASNTATVLLDRTER